MKHFCYLSAYFPKDDGLITTRQGRSLVEAGFKVTYVISGQFDDEIIHGIDVISTGSMPGNRLQRIISSKSDLYKKALELNADIYQISEPQLISLGLKLLRHGKKVIFNMRENYPAVFKYKTYIPKIVRIPGAKVLEIHMKRSLKKYLAVFSSTEGCYEMTKNDWGIKNSYLLTNFPVVNERFSLSYEEYLNRGNVLCYLGSIYRISRQEYIFKALENTPQVSYLLAGKFWEKDYADYIMSLPYWEKIDFIGGFKREEMPSLYARASMCNVLRDFSKTASPNGSVGVLKIYESMEAGLPIICSDVKLYREMVDKYQCGICVDPNNSEQIKNAIEYLINNKEIAYSMGQNARLAVINEYNWKSQEVIYNNIINKILSE